MMHNDRLCKDIEERLNVLIRDINEAGGMIWLQSKSNKEHYYKLDGEVTIGLLMYTVEKKEEDD
jgi:hypothetical protein